MVRMLTTSIRFTSWSITMSPTSACCLAPMRLFSFSDRWEHASPSPDLQHQRLQHQRLDQCFGEPLDACCDWCPGLSATGATVSSPATATASLADRKPASCPPLPTATASWICQEKEISN